MFESANRFSLIAYRSLPFALPLVANRLSLLAFCSWLLAFRVLMFDVQCSMFDFRKTEQPNNQITKKPKHQKTETPNNRIRQRRASNRKT
jgi:hypothetical protein